VVGEVIAADLERLQRGCELAAVPGHDAIVMVGCGDKRRRAAAALALVLDCTRLSRLFAVSAAGRLTSVQGRANSAGTLLIGPLINPSAIGNEPGSDDEP
jgi:hypothetical protein